MFVARSVRGWRTLFMLAIAFTWTAALAAKPLSVEAETLTPAQVYALALPAVPLVETPVGHGTGFLVDATHVVTDAHVVGQRSAVRVRFPGGIDIAEARVVARDPMADLAVIAVSDLGVTPLALSSDAQFVTGSELLLVGYPSYTEPGADPTLSRGLISRIRRWEAADLTYLQTDAAGAGGMSGGPVLDGAGQVVGITQFQVGGTFLLALSGRDVSDRVRRLLNGENVDGVSSRAPAGARGTQFSVDLSEAPGQQGFLLRATSNGLVTFSVSGGGPDQLTWIEMNSSAGDHALEFFSGSTASAGLRFDVVAGEEYSIVLEALVTPAGPLTVTSSTPVIRLSDPDHAPLTDGASTGLLDFPGDQDCRPVDLQAGERLDVRVETVRFDPALGIYGSSGRLVAEDDDGGGGLFGLDAHLTYAAAAGGRYLVCLRDVSSNMSVGGYFLITSRVAPAPPPAGAGGFLQVASMTSARAGHVAVRLQDGRVFVAGGSSGERRLASAEIFDPVDGTFHAVQAQDTQPRFLAGATLLADGRVLIVGGADAQALRSASIYSPGDGSWVATGPLTDARIMPSVVLLPGGQVLVAGGFTVDESGAIAQDTAEVFDPATSSFQPVGRMLSPHAFGSTALLPSGKVLFAGGETGSGMQVAAAETFDPATRTFAATAPLNTARSGAAAALLPDGSVLIAGGMSAGRALRSAEIYDPTAGLFRPAADLNTARDLAETSVLDDGRILFSGGLNDAAETLASTELFDPVSRAFVLASPMSSARYLHRATVLRDGSVLITGGGAAPNEALVEAERYQPAVQRFSPAPTGVGTVPTMWSGGTIDELVVAAGPNLASVWAFANGRAYGYLPSAPEFVNREFLALFPGSVVPPNTIVLLVYR